MPLAASRYTLRNRSEKTSTARFRAFGSGHSRATVSEPREPLLQCVAMWVSAGRIDVSAMDLLLHSIWRHCPRSLGRCKPAFGTPCKHVSGCVKPRIDDEQRCALLAVFPGYAGISPAWT